MNPVGKICVVEMRNEIAFIRHIFWISNHYLEKRQLKAFCKALSHCAE